MHVTVLGSGTCVPLGHRNSAGYWIDTGASRVRFDCGAGTVHAMQRYGLAWTTLTHQFITHFHIDHVGELPALLFAFKYGRMGSRSEPLTLVGPKGLEYYLMSVMGLYRMKLLDQEFPVLIRELDPGGEIDLLGGDRLRVAKTPHTLESLAVRIDASDGSVGFTGDSAYAAHLETFFDSVDVLIAECSFVEDRKGTAHLNADDVCRIATGARVGHLVATHHYFDPEDADLAAVLTLGFGGRVTIASDGARVEVGARSHTTE